MDRIAIISGRGSLPEELAIGLKASGNAPFIIGIEGECERWIEQFDHAVLPLEKLGSIFQLIEKGNCRKVVMAGSIVRPRLHILKMDWGAIRSLPDVFAFMIGGDNSLLSGVIRLFEKKGFEIIGAHTILPDLLIKSGAIAGRKPGGKTLVNLQKAMVAAKTLGGLDIGQAAVAVGGRVIAVEGIEGTDGMLERIADMRRSGRLYENGRYGVMVKTMKPGQEMRIDLPTIGPDTINRLSEAGLRGICIEAGHTLLLEKDKTLRLARFHNIFIYGLEPIVQQETG